ncbi:MAG: FmdB family zinc ribbon protein, partial [bacterium]
MPIYEYKCKKCGKIFEVIQKFSDDAIKECKYCQGPVKKIFSAPSIVFKGSGFHVNDYKSGKVESSGHSPSKEAKKEEK